MCWTGKIIGQEVDTDSGGAYYRDMAKLTNRTYTLTDRNVAYLKARAERLGVPSASEALRRLLSQLEADDAKDSRMTLEEALHGKD